MPCDCKSETWVYSSHESICDWNKRFYPGLVVGNALKCAWSTLKDAKACDDRGHPGHDRGLCQLGDGVEKKNQKLGVEARGN